MSFLSPLALAWLAVAGPVILLYFLKLKRRRLRVSSTWLWTKSIEDLRVNAPFQRLRRSLLLLLQLLLIALAALALAQPVGTAAPPEEKRWVLLVDRSASMQMKDVAPSRLEAAKEKARALLDEIGPDDPVMVVAFADRAWAVTPFTTSRTQAERAIASIEPSDAPGRIQDAYRIAASALQGMPNREIVVLSDGGVEPIQGADETLPLRYLAVGAAPRNTGITALDVRSPRKTGDPWTVFAQVDHFDDRAREVTLELQVNGRLRAVKKVALEPDTGTGVLFETTGADPEVVQVTIAEEDDLDLDNRAWFTVRPEKARILLAGQENLFLENALAQARDAEAFRISGPPTGSVGEADVVVLDGVMPESLPEGRYLIFGGLPRWEGIEAGPPVENPDVVDWDRRHPLARMVDFRDILIAEAPKVTLSGYAVPVVEAASTPLAFAWEKGRTRAVVVTFDLLRSDWPFHLSFPLFVANALEWLRGDAENRVRPGDPLRIRLAEDQSEAEVIAPGGAARTLRGNAGGDVVFGGTERAGLYTVRRGEDTRAVAVNLFDPHESAGRVAAGLATGPGKIARSGVLGPPLRPWWRWLALGVLLLLAAEWFVYHRRISL